MSWGLLVGVSRGWRCVFRIADRATWTGGSRRSGEPKRLLLKGRTESSFLGFGTVPGVREV